MTKFIAEIGGNHGGSLKTALKTIDAACDAGADYVKFQSWEADTMAIPGYIIKDGPWAGRELLDLYRETHTPWYWHERLFAHAWDIGIIPFSTPFDTASVALLEALECPLYKIASLEINDTELLRCVGRTGKPVILSTGAASDIEIAAALSTLRQSIKSVITDITLLHCVSAYPTRHQDANLMRMVNMSSNYDGDAVGLSDHSQGSLVPMAATALGASIIEKHFILDRNMETPDCAFSLEPAEFKNMVESCRQVEAMLKPPTSDVEESSRLLKRSLYYARDLRQGHILELGDFITRRPAAGLDPVCLNTMIGKPLMADVSHNQPAMLSDTP